MPDHLQMLWLEHTRNEVSGAYFAQEKGGAQSASEARRIEREAIERAQGGSE